MRLIPTAATCTISWVSARTDVTAVRAIAEYIGFAAPAVSAANDATAVFPAIPNTYSGGTDKYTAPVILATNDATSPIPANPIPGASD
jgi:hypothetical protein